MKGQREKIGEYQWEEWAQEKGERRCIQRVCFVSIYENRRMKPAEIVLRRGVGEKGRMMEGVNPTKTHFKHICKYHNISPCTSTIC
jgi:hypothetical protein